MPQTRREAEQSPGDIQSPQHYLIPPHPMDAPNPDDQNSQNSQEERSLHLTTEKQPNRQRETSDKHRNQDIIEGRHISLSGELTVRQRTALGPRARPKNTQPNQTKPKQSMNGACEKAVNPLQRRLQQIEERLDHLERGVKKSREHEHCENDGMISNKNVSSNGETTIASSSSPWNCPPSFILETSKSFLNDVDVVFAAALLSRQWRTVFIHAMPHELDLANLTNMKDLTTMPRIWNKITSVSMERSSLQSLIGVEQCFSDNISVMDLSCSKHLSNLMPLTTSPMAA